ncbi:hypothetical protein ACFLZY_02170 [Patescibacteria group bacterium]
MGNNETTTDEIMGFLKDHMVTKGELVETESRILDKTKGEINRLEQKIIDKMDEKFADLEGTVIARQRKQDNKVNKILELIERHDLAPSNEIQAIREINIFPPAPQV